MDVLKLIEVVQEHKCLYDAKNEHYKNIVIRENVWKNEDIILYLLHEDIIIELLLQV